MSGDQIGKSGTPLALPEGVRLGAIAQLMDNPKVKRTLFCGSTATPVLEKCSKDWYFIGTREKQYAVVRPNAYPYYLLEESPGEMRLFVYSGPYMEPVQILQELTKTCDRRAVLITLKQLAKNDEPVPMHEIDLLDLANRVADGRIKL